MNNGPIASNETSFEDSIVNINNTDLSVPSVIQFNKKNDSNNGSENKDNIIKKLTNPKTWNNGIVVLLISMIVIGGSSYVLIKKKSL